MLFTYIAHVLIYISFSLYIFCFSPSFSLFPLFSFLKVLLGYFPCLFLHCECLAVFGSSFLNGFPPFWPATVPNIRRLSIYLYSHLLSIITYWNTEPNPLAYHTLEGYWTLEITWNIPRSCVLYIRRSFIILFSGMIV